MIGELGGLKTLHTAIIKLDGEQLRETRWMQVAQTCSICVIPFLRLSKNRNEGKTCPRFVVKVPQH